MKEVSFLLLLSDISLLFAYGSYCFLFQISFYSSLKAFYLRSYLGS